MEDLQKLEQLLKAHDWYYGRTEDPRVYRRGVEQREVILATIKDLESKGLGLEANDLYNQHRTG